MSSSVSLLRGVPVNVLAEALVSLPPADYRYFQALGLLPPLHPSAGCTCRCSTCGQQLEQNSEPEEGQSWWSLVSGIKATVNLVSTGLDYLAARTCQYLSQFSTRRSLKDDETILRVWLMPELSVDIPIDQPEPSSNIRGSVARVPEDSYELDYSRYRYSSGGSSHYGRTYDHGRLLEPTQPSDSPLQNGSRRSTNQRYRAPDSQRRCRRASQPTSPDTVEPQTVWGGEQEASSSDGGKQQPKVKKRHTASFEEDTSNANACKHCPSTTPETTVNSSAPSIRISESSHQVFMRLFDSHPSNKQPVRFNDFAAAMIDAGFTVSHSGRCAGSAVTFKDESNGRGTISFHRPHPDPTIDFHKLRTWGTRLAKKFGWEKESFVVNGD